MSHEDCFKAPSERDGPFASSILLALESHDVDVDLGGEREKIPLTKKVAWRDSHSSASACILCCIVMLLRWSTRCVAVVVWVVNLCATLAPFARLFRATPNEISWHGPCVAVRKCAPLLVLP